MKRGIITLSLVCLAIAAFLGTFVTSSSAEAMKLRYSSMWPPQHPHTVLMTEWGKDVEKATDGRVTVTMFASSTLSPPTQVYDNVVKGIVDVGSSLLAYSPGRLPLSEVLQQPFGYKNGYQATRLANAYYEKFKPKEFDDVKVMYLHAAAPGFIMTKNPVKSMKDVKGLRIKTNAENVDVSKNLGAAPVSMPVTETYDALQRGVIDGALFPVEALQGFKIAEVVKTVIEDYGTSYATSMYVIMNKDKWNAISPADQKAIEKLNVEYAEKIGKQWVRLDNNAKEFAKGKGVNFISPSTSDQAKTAKLMEPIFGKYVEMAESKGLPGKEALKFCQDFLKKNPE